MTPAQFRFYIGMTSHHVTGATIQYTNVQIKDVVVVALRENGFDGCSILYGTGLWKGDTEHCCIVDLVTTLDRLEAAKSVARYVAEQLDQDAVLFTVSKLELACLVPR